MDFHALVKKMQEIDLSPQTTQDTPTQECGMPMTPPPVQEPPVSPPSLSVNLNAQGMDHIEQIMKLISKVNPDTVPPPPPMPTMMPPPTVMSIKPINKLLPDFDADNDDKIGGEIDMMKPDLDMDHMEPDGDEGPSPTMSSDNDGDESEIRGLDRDGDGDHDMHDHEMEPDVERGEEDEEDEEDEEKKEAWDNEPNEQEHDVDYIVNKIAGGMNKGHDTYPKVSDGDNPMQKVRENDDFRTQIRNELLQRLAEAKGVK